jgi:tetratricopeptide (TPR) repeat protein
MTRLLLIGAGGLDWAGFDAGTLDGALPHLAALRERGAAGWLAGASSVSPLAAWTSLITGAQPERHGVWRGQEAWSGGVRAVTRASWRVPPVWARLEANGVRTGSVAWPAARPGDSWTGLHIDEDAVQPTSRDPADWALPLHALPPAARDAVRPLRAHPAQITAAMLAPLVPRLDAIDQSRDADLPALAVAMARASSIQACAAWMLRDGAHDAVFIHHPWLGELRPSFGTRRDGLFSDVIPGAWRFLDGLVGGLAALAPEALVMVVSPGWRDHAGAIVAAGPGVAPDPGPFGAHLLDVAPTGLARFALRDATLVGSAIAAIAETSELGPASAPSRSKAAPSDPALLRVARQYGYRPPKRPAAPWQAQALAELGLILLERAPAQARDAAEAALKRDPTNILALRVGVRANVILGQAAPLPDLADRLLAAAPERGFGALAWGAHFIIANKVALAAPWLRKAEADPDPTTLLTVASLWLAAGRAATAERCFKRVLDGDGDNVTALVGVAMAALARRDFIGAEAALLRARAHDPAKPAIHLQLAQLYAKTARKIEAARAADIARRLGAAPAQAGAAARGRLG